VSRLFRSGLVAGLILSCVVGVAPGPAIASDPPLPGQIASFSASRATVDSNNTVSTVTATASALVTAPWSIAIYDGTGLLLASCSSGSGVTSCGASLSVATNATRSTYAFVTQSAPAGQLPTSSYSSAGPVTVHNAGWLGTITEFTSSRTQVDSSNSVATVTAKTDIPVPAPYSISIYDDNDRLLAQCSSYSPTTCGASFSVPTNGTRSFRAFVAQDAPPSTVPSNDVRASAGPVGVHNAGWLGTITEFTASRTQVDANNTVATVTAKTDIPVPAPYSISIYDDNNHMLAQCSSYSPTTCGASFSVPTNGTRSFRAFVAQDAPSNALPSIDQRAASASVSVTNLGWTGGIMSFSTSRGQVDANNSVATVTATTDVPVPAPYSISIYDDNSNKLAQCNSNSPTTCGASFSVPTNSTRSFRAYVAQDAPSSAVPSNDVRAVAGPVSVHNAGWLGTITEFTSSRTQVDSSNSVATLTAKTDIPVPGPYSISIYDDNNTKLAECNSYTPTTCGASFSVPTNSTRSFRAYVAQDAPSSAVPSNDVRASEGPVSVHNAGWLGTITEFTASRTQVDANNNVATVTAKTDIPVPGPYSISIYDDNNNRLAQCNSYTPTSCGASFAVPTGHGRSFTAYVAQEAPTSTLPSLDVRAVAGPVVVRNTTWVEDNRDLALVAGVAGPKLAQKALSGLDACEPLLFDRVSPSAAGAPDLPDTYEACESTVAAGNPATIIAAILAIGGLRAVDLWVTSLFDNDPAPPPAPPTPGEPPVPTPRPAPSGSMDTWPTLPDEVLDDILLTMIVGPTTLPPDTPTHEQKREGLRQCFRLAYVANFTGGTQNPCQQAVLVVAQDAQQAAEHDLAALANRPDFFQLHYRPADVSPVTYEWRNDQEPCLDKSSTQQCDEYPFRSTEESDRSTVSLKAIDATHNSREGAVLGAMLGTCGFYADYDPQAASPRSYAVAPLPELETLSFFVCQPRTS
jgi:uncharacterized membrane protein